MRIEADQLTIKEAERIARRLKEASFRVSDSTYCGVLNEPEGGNK